MSNLINKELYDTLINDKDNIISNAMTEAFNLGQKYWQQADSESFSQNKLSYETQNKFLDLVKNTINSLGVNL